MVKTKKRLLGPVVQSIVSLTTLLRHQLVKYTLTTLSNTWLFFVGKMYSAKDSHIFSTKKYQCMCNIYFQNFNKTLTNDFVNFEQLGPGRLLLNEQSDKCLYGCKQYLSQNFGK